MVAKTAEIRSAGSYFDDKIGGTVLKLCKLGAIRARNEIKLHACLECKNKTALQNVKMHAGLDAHRLSLYHDHSCMIVFAEVYGFEG